MTNDDSPDLGTSPREDARPRTGRRAIIEISQRDDIILTRSFPPISQGAHVNFVNARGIILFTATKSHHGTKKSHHLGDHWTIRVEDQTVVLTKRTTNFFIKIPGTQYGDLRISLVDASGTPSGVLQIAYETFPEAT